MTNLQLLQFLSRELPSSFEARQLFAFVTGFAVSELPLCGGAAASLEQVELCRSLCGRRLAGEPLQYLLGEWEFYGLPLFVGEGVLIPRADTELLVDVALSLIKDMKGPEVLDLCSGSGCIPIALSHTRSDATVTAVELSATAHSYLVRNIARNKASVTAVQGDIRTYTFPRAAALITANPPYIPANELSGLQAEVGHEPVTALCGGQDGLDFYRVIGRRYLDQLVPGGALCLEVGAGQSGDVAELLEAHGFADLTVHRDLGGIQRVVVGKRPR